MNQNQPQNPAQEPAQNSAAPGAAPQAAETQAAKPADATPADSTPADSAPADSAPADSAPAPSRARAAAQLFGAFARIGAFTFGGGYAMLPMLRRECVESHHWSTEEELLDVFAIGQCTPGVIAVNTATFVGYRTAGVLGAVTATLGVVFPSLCIITALAAALSFVMDYPLVQSALAGVRVCVCVLIANAVLTLGKKALCDKFSVALYLIVLALAVFTGLSTMVLVLASGAVGLLTMFVPALNKAKAPDGAEAAPSAAPNAAKNNEKKGEE